MKHTAKKANIVLGFCAGILAIFIAITFFITVDFSAQAKDLQLYRLAGALLLSAFEVGLLLEMNLFGLRKKIPLINSTNIFKHVLFWFIISFVSLILFVIPYSMTSADFKAQISSQNYTPSIKKPPAQQDVPVTEVPTVPSTSASTQAPTPAPTEAPTEAPTAPSTSAPTQAPTETDYFIGKEGCSFSMSKPFELDGVSYTINRIKICSDLDYESPDYNFYKIFYEYTIQNNRNETIEWDMAYNGNYYGLLCHRGVERHIGGNTFIKDDSFPNMKPLSEGTLAAGEKTTGYVSLVCTPNQIDLPEETWPLYTNEPFALILHLLVNNTDYTLTLNFNQTSTQ